MVGLNFVLFINSQARLKKYLAFLTEIVLIKRAIIETHFLCNASSYMYSCDVVNLLQSRQCIMFWICDPQCSSLCLTPWDKAVDQEVRKGHNLDNRGLKRYAMPNITQSQGILSWKEPTRIIELTGERLLWEADVAQRLAGYQSAGEKLPLHHFPLFTFSSLIKQFSSQSTNSLMFVLPILSLQSHGRGKGVRSSVVLSSWLGHPVTLPRGVLSSYLA